MFRRKKPAGDADKGGPEIPEDLGIPAKPGKLPLGMTAPNRPASLRPLEVTRPVDPVPRPPEPARFEPVRRVAETPPAAPPAAPAAANPPQENDMRRLTVGRDISLSGEITSCDRLVVEGSVEANLANCRDIDIAESGLFKGSASIDEAEIRGRFEGTLEVRNRLLIRATGRVIGTVRYGQIEIERGGQISGDVEARPSSARPAPDRPTDDRPTDESSTDEQQAADKSATGTTQPVLAATETETKY